MAPLYVTFTTNCRYRMLITSQGPWRDLHYVESHLSSLMNKPMADSDLFTLVNSGGEPVVDTLLYLIPHSGKFIRHDRMDLTDMFQDLDKKMQSISNVLNA